MVGTFEYTSLIPNAVTVLNEHVEFILFIHFLSQFLITFLSHFLFTFHSLFISLFIHFLSQFLSHPFFIHFLSFFDVEKDKRYARRWYILVMFSILSATQSTLWISYGAVADTTISLLNQYDVIIHHHHH